MERLLFIFTILLQQHRNKAPLKHYQFTEIQLHRLTVPTKCKLSLYRVGPRYSIVDTRFLRVSSIVYRVSCIEYRVSCIEYRVPRNYKNYKITRRSAYAPYESGGLKMISYEEMIKALRLRWLIRVIDVDYTGFWKLYLNDLLRKLGGIFLLQCNYDINQINIPSTFYYELLLWWSAK